MGSMQSQCFSLPANESKYWTKLEVETMVEGYSYSTRGTAPKIAMVFLLLYCILESKTNSPTQEYRASSPRAGILLQG